MPPCGAGRCVALPLNGLNFAITAMVAPRLARACKNRGGMTRRAWIAAAALTASCGRNSAPLGLLRENAAGGWRRTALREMPVSEAPDPVPRNAVMRLEAAQYEGPGKLEARVYELNSAEVGSTLAQRWRPSADTVFFSRGRYFVVVKWQQAERGALREFVRELEGEIQRGKS